MLNNRQKAQLKALGNELMAIGQIGKNGISETLLDFLDEALTRHELIKIKILKSCPLSSREVIEGLETSLACQLIQSIGKTVLLYRRSEEEVKIKLVK